MWVLWWIYYHKNIFIISLNIFVVVRSIVYFVQSAVGIEVSGVGSCYGCFLFVICTICLDDTIICIVIIGQGTHYHHGRIDINNFSNQSIAGAVSAIIVLELVQEDSIHVKSKRTLNTKNFNLVATTNNSCTCRRIIWELSWILLSLFWLPMVSLDTCTRRSSIIAAVATTWLLIISNGILL